MASVMRADPARHCTIVDAAEHATAGGFKAGDLVKFASGKVQIATAGAINAIALKDASGTVDTAIPVELIDNDTVYVTPYKASATALATNMHVQHDFVFTAGAHTLDESGASTDCYVVGTLDAWATSGGRLLWKIKPAATIQA